MNSINKPLVWLHGEVKTPPLSHAARIEAGFLLRRMQRGESLDMPHSRPMPVIGPRCHEIDADAVVLVEVFNKKATATPRTVIDACKKRLREYDNA